MWFTNLHPIIHAPQKSTNGQPAVIATSEANIPLAISLAFTETVRKWSYNNKISDNFNIH